MFWSIVSLLLLAVLVRLGFLVVRAFMVWLGHGKAIERAKENRDLPDDVRVAAEKLYYYHHLRQYNEEIGKPTKLSWEQTRQIIHAEHLVRDDYVDHMRIGWYQIVILFVVGSVGGLFLEELWMYITAGLTQGRYGLVWGPFSPLYGFGAVLLTLISLWLRHHNAKWWQVFLMSMLVGGLLEQITGWSMETFMGAVSWDYTYVPGHITRWVAWPFLFFWGVLGLVWEQVVMPWLLHTIGEPTTRRQVIFVLLLAAYLALDIFMTLACFTRRAQRDKGIPARTEFEEWIDEHYSNQFMSQRFENMVIEGGHDD